jgi:hypothetical protein
MLKCGGQMLNIFLFTKLITNFSKFDSDIRLNPSFGSLYNFVNVRNDQVEIHFKQNLNQTQIDALSLFMSSFSNVSVVDTYKNYLGAEIDPFGKQMMLRIRAENISMGITQAGKTADCLGFFNHLVLLPGKVFPISFQMAFDSSSFYEVIALINYFLLPENQNLYSTLTPFVTAERLTAWRTEVIARLSA